MHSVASGYSYPNKRVVSVRNVRTNIHSERTVSEIFSFYADVIAGPEIMAVESEIDRTSALQFLIRRASACEEPTLELQEAAAPAIAFYLRKSTRDPAFLSLRLQLTECRLYARSIGDEADQRNFVYEDRNRSGATVYGREGLARACQDAEKGLYGIFVARTGCRVTRNASDAARFFEHMERCGVAIHIVGHGKVQQYLFIMLAYSAQRNRETTLANVASGMRAALENKQLFGQWPSFGYDQIEGQAGRDWIVNEAQAAIVRRGFEELDSGTTLSGLAKLFNAGGLATRRGGFWTPSHFFGKGHGLLDRLIVKGIFVWSLWGSNPIVIRRPDLAIVDAELFDRVNERFGIPSQTTRRKSESPFIRGLVRCACGTAMKVYEGNPSFHLYCAAALAGACDRTDGLPPAIVARHLLDLFRKEILHPDLGPELEQIRRREWKDLEAAVQMRRNQLAARLQTIADELDERSPDDDDDVDPYVMAECCDLELEHHVLSEELSALEVAPFPELDWTQVETARAKCLRIMERLPQIGRSPDEIEIVELVRSIVGEIELDLRPDGYRMRIWFGVPGAPKGYDRCNRLCGSSWTHSFPSPPQGPLRYPEVVLGHHRHAEAGNFALDDDEHAAIEPVVRSLHRLARQYRNDRSLAEALIFLGMTGLGTPYLPSCYSHHAACLDQIGIQSAWRRVYEILRERGSPVVANASPSVLAQLGASQAAKRPHPVPP